MTLDEDGFSDVSSAGLVEEIRAAAYHGVDIRPAWIGGRRPRTDIAELKGLRHWADVHYDYYLNFVREYVDRRGHILDIGCGAGQCVAMLARYGESATGMDSDVEVIAFANKHNVVAGATFVRGAFPSKWFGDKRYDYIFCVETMEHIAHDQQDHFLDRALALLTPGGLMFITTPREDTPSPPHIGVWSEGRAETIAARLGDRVLRRAYFSNTNPAVFLDEPATHHAWVLR